MTSPDFPTPSMDPRRSAAIESMLTSTVVDDADARRTTRSHRRNRGILIASLATACVVVAGGLGYAATRGSVTAPHGGGVAVPSSVPSSKPSATTKPTGSGAPVIVDPAGTATPVPTPTPTLDLADPSTWTITFDGVGPLTIGGDQTQQLTPMHVAFDGEPSPGSNIAVCPTIFFRRHSQIPNAPSLLSRGAPAGGTVDLVGVGDGSISQTGSDLATLIANSPKTAKGIGIGQTLEQLRAAYPGIAKVGVGYSGTIYAIENAQGEWMSFGVPESGLIVDITVSRDAMPPSEYCA